MTKFALIILLLVCASVALTFGAEAAATLDGCTCTCPKKAVASSQQTEPAAVVKSRKRRQATAASNTRFKRFLFGYEKKPASVGIEFKPRVAYADSDNDSRRNKRFFFSYDHKTESTTNIDHSKHFQRGDLTSGSNNGGNTRLNLSAGSMVGSGNEGMHYSQGTVGGSVAGVNSEHSINIGK